METVSFVALGELDVPPLILPTPCALALLGWVGLPVDTFASLPAPEVRWRCMRRLWRVRRHDVPLRVEVERLFALAEAAGQEGYVLVS